MSPPCLCATQFWFCVCVPHNSAFISVCPCKFCFCVWVAALPSSALWAQERTGESGESNWLWWFLAGNCNLCFSLVGNWREKSILQNITNTENYCEFSPPHFPLLLHQQEGFGGFLTSNLDFNFSSISWVLALWVILDWQIGLTDELGHALCKISTVQILAIIFQK